MKFHVNRKVWNYISPHVRWNFRFAKKHGIRCGLRGFGLSYPSLCQDPLRCTHQVGQVSTWPLCPKKRFHVSLRGCTSLPISFLPLFPCHLKDFIFGLDFLCFRLPLCPFPLCYLIGVWDLLFLSANGQGQILDHLVSCQLDIWEVKTLKHTVNYNSNQNFPGPLSCRIFSTTARCFVSYCSLLCLITWLRWSLSLSLRKNHAAPFAFVHLAVVWNFQAPFSHWQRDRTFQYIH